MNGIILTASSIAVGLTVRFAWQAAVFALVFKVAGVY